MKINLLIQNSIRLQKRSWNLTLKNALRTFVCFITPFISVFLCVTNLLLQVDYPQWNQDHQQPLCSSPEF